MTMVVVTHAVGDMETWLKGGGGEAKATVTRPLALAPIGRWARERWDVTEDLGQASRGVHC
jgi:hypothetical protein